MDPIRPTTILQLTYDSTIKARTWKQATVQYPKSFLDSFKEFLDSKTVPQKMMGLGGLAGLLLNIFNPSEQGIIRRGFSIGIDILAIASVFNPALILPVAGLYMLRGAITLLNGGGWAGLVEIGIALLPGFRNLKQVGKILNIAAEKGFGKAFNVIVRNGYGSKAYEQYKYAKAAVTSKAAMKETIKTSVTKTGTAYATARTWFNEGVQAAVATG